MAGSWPRLGGTPSLTMVSFGRGILAPGGMQTFGVVGRLFVAVVGVGDAHVPPHHVGHCLNGIRQHPPVDTHDVARASLE